MEKNNKLIEAYLKSGKSMQDLTRLIQQTPSTCNYCGDFPVIFVDLYQDGGFKVMSLCKRCMEKLADDKSFKEKIIEKIKQDNKYNKSEVM